MLACGGVEEIASLSEWLRALRASASFEHACGVLLSRLRAVVEGAITGASGARGLVHLRSEGEGYRALVVEEWSGLTGPLQIAPSATVWRWVDRHAQALGVDLGTSTGTVLGDADREVPVDAPYVAHDATASMHHMLARATTHLVALPLTGGAGRVAGMVSLELSWPAGTAARWPEGAWRADLQLLCDIAAPFLLGAPSTPASVGAVDPLLPVAGARMRALLRVLSVFVEQDETLLLSGPTGSGKSRLAEWCHARSPRASGPFEVANLLALPEAMQMGELFGWRRGAFTGAHEDHDGLVTGANGGTLFLDEIDKLSLGAQAGLLRFLETRRYSPLGASRERTADVRVIVGTNADLPALVRSGAFREDLYYRINVLPVRLEPLAERTDEIADWARWMLRRRHTESGHDGALELTDAAVALLATAPWPGNLRQLDNVVRRSYAYWLAERSSGDSRRVGEEHVARALAAEGQGLSSRGGASTAEALEMAARHIVEAALEVRRRGGTLPLDAVDVMRGAVLEAARDRLGGVKDAYLLFGGEALVRSRNHAREFRRHVSRLEELLELLET